MTTGRLLFVHAHPDDESSKGAATAARYADEGAVVVLVTATDGAAGEILNPALEDTDVSALPAIRADELARATRAIGFTRNHSLGEPDSGWHEDLAAVPEDVFYSRPVEGPAHRLAAILRQERPHVMVTYSPDGGYPHPDHIQTHVVSMAAADLAADPSADLAGEVWEIPRIVYATGFPWERVEGVHHAMVARGLTSPYADWIEGADERGQRDADKPCDVRLDVAAWFPRRDEALLAHATQVDPDGPWFRVPRDLEVEVFPWETYVLLRGVPYPDGASDLFDGLDGLQAPRGMRPLPHTHD